MVTAFSSSVIVRNASLLFVCVTGRPPVPENVIVFSPARSELSVGVSMNVALPVFEPAGIGTVKAGTAV